MLTKNGICYKICNSTTMELTTDKYVEPIVKDSRIVELQIGDDSVKLQQMFKIPVGNRTITYEVNHILKVNKNTYLLKTELQNKTTQYILPLLEKLQLDKKTLKQFDSNSAQDLQRYCKNTYLINAYLGGESFDRLDGYLYLKFKFSPHIMYQIMEEYITTSHPLFVKVLDQGDDYTYYKFRIPNEFHNDLFTFLEGKYSKLSNALKARIVTFYGLKQDSNLYQIITGGDAYREKLSRELGYSIDGELDSIPEAIHELILI